MTTATALPNCFAPVFWEPVEATGERLAVGAVVRFDNQVSVHRIIRDDILDCLYGKKAANTRILIDTAMQMVKIVAQASMESIACPVGGFSVGAPRYTEPKSIGDALRVCALMYSSLANINSFDELEESDAPAPEEASRRFSTEVRKVVTARRPDLADYFSRSAVLIDGGEPVRFGFCSHKAVLHFGLLHPVRQASGVRDARARLWELSRAREIAALQTAALIVGAPRMDDPTLSGKQIDALRRNLLEIEREADANAMRFFTATTVDAAADRVIEFAD
ncbi:MAG: hypothetical protein JNK52_16490 [Zoogloeaceae bacterium]|nr:hypothetical protein [Zoogloeaceae bacterium]